MYHLSSSSSPSIRKWDQHNAETPAGKSLHCKVKWIYRVRSHRSDKFNCLWHWVNLTEEARKSRNYNCKFPNEIHIWNLDFINIYWIDRQNAPNWQWRTFKPPKSTKTPGISHSFQSVIWLTFHNTPSQTKRYVCHVMYSKWSRCYHPVASWVTFPGGHTYWQWMQLRRNCCEGI